mmetsp:Transcript_43900/g.80222  ORF Transcript_43900/g.80222 Transcript_43900/m.80222 type:complete len:405 (-) Transcript_43900:103-1317(-)
MLPELLLIPLWYIATIALPLVQSLHAMQKASADMPMWLLYWLCYAIGSLLFPYVAVIDRLLYIPFWILSSLHYLLDLYLEAQIVAVLMLVLPKPMLLRRLYRKLMLNRHIPYVVVWNAVLMVSLLPACGFSMAGLALVKVVPEARRADASKSLGEAVIVLTSLGWRFTLVVCSWVQLHCEGADEFIRECGSSGRPVVILPNHVSFVDIIMTVVLTPLARATKVKMMISQHVFSMPGIGIIAKAMGHLSVPFKSQDVEKFDVDKVEVEKRVQAMDAHIKAGGYGGWFPEGRVNPGDPHEVQTFRAGGFKVAVANDVEVWCLAQVGNSATWPKKSAIGGRPARIGYKIFRVCTSTKEFCANAAFDNNDAEAAEKVKCMFLANSCKDKVQAAVTDLVKAGFSGIPAR